MIIGLMRVKNESKNIVRSVSSALNLGDKVIVFDDHSSDDTAAKAGATGALVISSPFPATLDESRDKEYLVNLSLAYKPDWLFFLDADEYIPQKTANRARELSANHLINALSFRILYLWNNEKTVRVDGAFGNFYRQSMWRVNHTHYTFEKSGKVGNLHCGCIPLEAKLGINTDYILPVLHYGSYDAETRARKLAWYRGLDPNDKIEDGEHMNQGDPGGPPADKACKWAGPMEFKPLSELL